MGQEWRASVMVTAKLGKTHAFRQDPEVVWTSPGESEQKQRRLCLCLLSAAAGTEGLTVGRIPFTTIREWLQNSQPIDKAEIKRTCCTVSCDDGRSTTVVESSAAVQVLAIRALTALLTHSPRTHPLCATIDLFLFIPPSTSCTMGLSFTKKLQTWLSNWDILLRALLFLHPPPRTPGEALLRSLLRNVFEFDFTSSRWPKAWNCAALCGPAEPVFAPCKRCARARARAAAAARCSSLCHFYLRSPRRRLRRQQRMCMACQVLKGIFDSCIPFLHPRASRHQPAAMALLAQVLFSK